MIQLYRLFLLILLLLGGKEVMAQRIVRGKIVDGTTKEPVAGATIKCTKENCTCGCLTNSNGEFEMKCTDCEHVAVTSLGYLPQQIALTDTPGIITLTPQSSLLQEVVITANRGEGAKRSEAPVAIASISTKMLQDAKATTADQVLNKVSGVNMVSLGNEQHQMSIRQPMTTKSLFLYLEDGIPIRTTGLFNHNALLEMNMAATKAIEVIKGPSSSLYGSEAIGGVVNFITTAPTVVPVFKLSAQGNNVGYKRADLSGSITAGKLGFVLSGYYADKRNGYLEYSDYHKGTGTARIDYKISDRTSVTNSLSYVNYYSQMSGTIDSAMFANHTFRNLQTFTYRSVEAFRNRTSLSHSWSNGSKTTVTALYRNNTIGQNPAYRIKDDYRKQGNSYVGKKDLAHGEINSNSFQSYSAVVQHRQNFYWKNAVLIAGGNIDLSPSSYNARYIKIKKDTVTKKYVSYQTTDSVLTNYATDLNNYAGFINFEFSPVQKLRVVASLRYDVFDYNFDNHLTPSAFSGSRDTLTSFSRISPKIGFTYNFSKRTGLYANYSEGFVPPQVTELYTGVKVPELSPSVFYNYEAGGWAEVIKNKLTIDASAYRLAGTNEIISVKQDDGSFANQNTGKTLHQGIELGVNTTIAKDLSIRFSGAYSKHEFVSYVEKGISYNGNQMNNAPNWLYNVEAWYKPSFAKGLRVGAELQHVGEYFVDPRNTAKYEGYNVLNLRTGYAYKGFEVWMNVLNATDNYYSYITSKSTSGYSYQVAEPRNFTVGLSYDLANAFKKKQ